MVPGAIGILQAVEAVKVVTGIGSIMHDRLMMYDSLHCSFHRIKKPPPIANCAVCSPNAIIKTMMDSERSMENVRGPVSSACVPPPSEILAADQNVSCLQYSDVCKKGLQHILLDVRQARQYEMCSLDGAINLPLDGLESQLDTVGQLSRGGIPVYCICRRGIASAEATRILQNSIDDGNAYGIHSVYNISGGLNSWVETVDADFPHY
jgi:adenylyltransferase/sulfurtransferase